MKEKLMVLWDQLNEERFNTTKENIWPIWRDMDRIALILKNRYNYIVPY